MSKQKPKPPLPAAWVEDVFARLALAYGHAFLQQYDGMKLALVHADWAQRLARFGELDEDGKLVDARAVFWALDNLPDTGRPPNVFEFRRVCAAWRSPDEPMLALEPPREVPAKLAAKVAELLAKPPEDPRPLRVRNAARYVSMWGNPGVRLSPQQKSDLAMWRKVLQRWEAEQAELARKAAKKAEEKQAQWEREQEEARAAADH